jgi:phage shock protein B
VPDVAELVVGDIGVFVAFPWIILHYVTQWKKSATLTLEDERLDASLRWHDA